MENPDTYYSDYSGNNESYWNYSVSSAPEEDHCKGHNRTDVLFAGFAICIVVVGLIGNLLVFSTIVILREYKHSITNWYILQLNIADTLFLAMLPLTAHSELVGTWDFSLALCKFKEAVLFINYYASIYFLVVMSFDRYLAVTEALYSNSKLSSLRMPIASYIITVLGWVISVLLCIQLYTYSTITSCKLCAYHFPLDDIPTTELAGFEESNFDDNYYGYLDYSNLSEEEVQNIYDYISQHIANQQALPTQAPEKIMCKIPQSHTLKVWIYGNFIGAFCVPFLLICFFYGYIMTKISSATTSVTCGLNNVQRRYKRRVTLIVLALVTLFAVSWLPWYVDKILRINGIMISESGCRNLSSSVRGLAYLNSALNPYFYSRNKSSSTEIECVQQLLSVDNLELGGVEASLKLDEAKIFLGTHFRERLQRVYSRIGLPTIFKSVLPGRAGEKRGRRTTPRSSGVTKCMNKQRNRNSLGRRQYGHYPKDMRRSSLSIKTERTIV